MSRSTGKLDSCNQKLWNNNYLSVAGAEAILKYLPERIRAALVARE
ncbi:hypothetical protein [Tychonema sp. LEGE 07203]|nr:hypothetical protein [Tychonema sp. LEGE 07203]